LDRIRQRDFFTIAEQYRAIPNLTSRAMSAPVPSVGRAALEIEEIVGYAVLPTGCLRTGGASEPSV
jgi:hypothetical protein